MLLGTQKKFITMNIRIKDGKISTSIFKDII